MTRPAPVLASILLLAACSADTTEAPPDPSTGGGGAGGEGGGGGLPTVELSWSPCPLFSDGTGPEAECATPSLPLRADEPAGDTLSVYVKRYATPQSSRSTQLWMLAGGPGASSIIYEHHADLLTQADDSLEIYLPDHRGTGDSSRLGCPFQEADTSQLGAYVAPPEWPGCAEAVQAEWGSRLDAFTVTNAANDIGILVESARRDDAQVVVFGASYGTFWGGRYLQLFPDQADGVILDAIAPPTASLARQDLHADEASVDLFQACIDDPGCGPRFAGDPRAFALDLYDRLDAGHCPGIQIYGPARVLLRQAFGQMMMGWNGRRLIPAALVRADRCAGDDVAAIQQLFEYFFFPDAGSELLLREWGWVLSYYVVFSELFETPEPSIEQMAQWRDQAVVSRDVTSGFDAPIAVLPRYEHDRWYGGLADTGMPLLMLQGTWDPATRPGPAAVLRDHFTGEHQHWVEIPRGAHGVLATLPTTTGASCGTAMVLSFLDDPLGTPDTSCLADLAPLTFDGTPALNMALFGTEDAWGDP
jgi:pimeloyl-ACP methyl ester carboxylesterase